VGVFDGRSAVVWLSLSPQPLKAIAAQLSPAAGMRMRPCIPAMRNFDDRPESAKTSVLSARSGSVTVARTVLRRRSAFLPAAGAFVGTRNVSVSAVPRTTVRRPPSVTVVVDALPAARWER
jgi:hypothetical protein